jgi:hypothetical protein
MIQLGGFFSAAFADPECAASSASSCAISSIAYTFFPEHRSSLIRLESMRSPDGKLVLRDSATDNSLEKVTLEFQCLFVQCGSLYLSLA